MDDSVNSPRIPGYASVKEAAEMLGLSPRTVYDYIEEGRLPSARLADVIAIPIEEIRKKKQHLFPGTVMRYIAAGSNSIERVFLLLVWRGTVIPDEMAREAALKEFQHSLDDVVDWSTAQYEYGQVLMHT